MARLNWLVLVIDVGGFRFPPKKMSFGRFRVLKSAYSLLGLRGMLRGVRVTIFIFIYFLKGEWKQTIVVDVSIGYGQDTIFVTERIRDVLVSTFVVGCVSTHAVSSVVRWVLGSPPPRPVYTRCWHLPLPQHAV